MSLPALQTLSMGGVMLAALRREIALGLRQKGEVLTPLVFFVVIASLFPLGVGPESALLLRMAPGVLWVSALLAAMLSAVEVALPFFEPLGLIPPRTMTMLALVASAGAAIARIVAQPKTLGDDK